MGIVYGDSTPFPYEENFIEISKDLIDCCVALFSAQHTIATSSAHSGEREQHRKAERAKLEALAEALRRAVATATGERARKASGRAFDAAKGVIDRETADLEAQTAAEISACRNKAEEARQSAFRAVEAFLSRHDLPKTATELRLFGSEKGYTAKVQVNTPFGVDALFSVLVPPQSDWAKPRRIGDISAGTEVHLPQSAGWLSKRIELQAVRLDKLFLSELSVSEDKTTLSLRKGPTSGGGYLFEIIAGAPPQLAIATLGEDGLPTETARALSGDDFTHGLRLWTKLVPATRGINRRQAMLSANFGGRPLQENDGPEGIGLRLIQILTPILKEIAKRSLAPGELILRRDLGEGRREELYATKAELYEKIVNLPPAFQLLFDPLELSNNPQARPAVSGLLRMEHLIKQQPAGPVPSAQVLESPNTPSPLEALLPPAPKPAPPAPPPAPPPPPPSAQPTPPPTPPRNTPGPSLSGQVLSAPPTAITSLPLPVSLQPPTSSSSGQFQAQQPPTLPPPTPPPVRPPPPPAPPRQDPITQEIPIQPFDEEMTEFFEEELTKAKP